MSIYQYIKDKAWIVLLQISGMFCLSYYLLAIQNSIESVLLIWGMWIFVIFLYFCVDYHERKKYFDEIDKVLSQLEQKYLIGEVMKPGNRLEDQMYHEILLRSNKSVIEEIHELKEAEQEYKEFLEKWIHDTKTPLTAIQLLCSNHKDETTRKIQLEASKLEKQIETALYYARMEKAYQDYLIHPVDLKQVTLTAIQKNKQYFIQSGMQIEMMLEETIVSTDEKWVLFLLDQVFMNAIKYKREKNPTICISVLTGEKNKTLCVEDNGIGICKEDLPRIFQKGFTGKNGRGDHASTGIGLYLCKRLCEKLDIGLKCESETEKYTRILFTFPDSDFARLQK